MTAPRDRALAAPADAASAKSASRYRTYQAVVAAVRHRLGQDADRHARRQVGDREGQRGHLAGPPPRAAGGTSNTFKQAGIAHSLLMGGSHHNPRLRATIASVGTLVNRLESDPAAQAPDRGRVPPHRGRAVTTRSSAGSRRTAARPSA